MVTGEFFDHRIVGLLKYAGMVFCRMGQKSSREDGADVFRSVWTTVSCAGKNQ